MNGHFKLGDWDRILRGESSWWFVPEAVFRLCVLYVILIVSLRLMGRRMSSGLSRNELLALTSLAAAIGPAMQNPSQGLLPPLIVAVWVVALQRALTLGTFHSHRFENLNDGVVTTLVSDGQIDLHALHQCSLPIDRLRGQLRGEGLLNLGQVERLFFEPGGSFSTVRRTEEQPGLSLVPEWDNELFARQQQVPDRRACTVCGATVSADAQSDPCPKCGARDRWAPAVCGRDRD